MPDQPTLADGSPAVDLEAAAAAVTADVHHPAAEALLLGLEWSDDTSGGSMPIRYPQRVKLVEALLASFDGAGAAIRGELEQAIPEALR
jgi:hypothetical protein